MPLTTLLADRDPALYDWVVLTDAGHLKEKLSATCVLMPVMILLIWVTEAKKHTGSLNDQIPTIPRDRPEFGESVSTRLAGETIPVTGGDGVETAQNQLLVRAHASQQ